MTVPLAVVVFGLSLAMAATAHASAPGTTVWSLATDLAVGVAFVLAAWLMSARSALRLLVFAVGIAWLVGSASPALLLSHQAVLGIALLAFPAPALRDPVRWIAVGAAVLLGLGIVPRPWPALVFAGIGIVCVADAARRGGSRWFPVMASTLLAAVLSALWTWENVTPRAFDTSLALHLYEGTLAVIALGFWLAAGRHAAEQSRAADLVLTDDGPAGIEGLGDVLAHALDDRSVRVTLPDEHPGARTPFTFEVVSDGRLVARVHHSSPALLDPRIASSVSQAVRLAIDHSIRAGELEHQLEALEEARRRLLSAADDQRESTAARIRTAVVEPLDVARAHVEQARHATTDAAAADALEIALHELEHASEDVLGLVSDVPPAALGGGGLAGALRDLAARTATPVSVSTVGEVASDAATERTLFYVATEAVTNALKHARASAIELGLRREGDDLVLVISDDGVGGAETDGSGIRGMADRLAARGGLLDVAGRPDGGTIVTATLPISRSASTD